VRKLEVALKELLNNEPLYAHLYLQCRLVISNKDNMKTACLRKGKDEASFTMEFNESFLNNLSVSHVKGVIKHELLHLIIGHLAYMKSNARAKNVAMDCAINQLIAKEDLPEKAIKLEDFEKMIGIEEKLLPMQTWEYYYSYIPQGDGIEYLDTLDEHADGDPDLANISEAEVREMVKNAIKAAAGNIPEELKSHIDILVNAESKIKWQTVLKNFIARAKSTERISTRKKPHRRLGIEVPGYKKKRELTVAACLDSSGSISEDDYGSFMAELVSVGKNVTKMHIIEADCVVQNIETVKKKGGKFNRVRRSHGGTAYQPAIDKAKGLKADVIIYFGDFDTSDTPQNPGVPFLWVGVGTQPKPGNFGMEVRL